MEKRRLRMQAKREKNFTSGKFHPTLRKQTLKDGLGAPKLHAPTKLTHAMQPKKIETKNPELDATEMNVCGFPLSVSSVNAFTFLLFSL